MSFAVGKVVFVRGFKFCRRDDGSTLVIGRNAHMAVTTRESSALFPKQSVAYAAEVFALQSVVCFACHVLSTNVVHNAGNQIASLAQQVAIVVCTFHGMAMHSMHWHILDGLCYQDVSHQSYCVVVTMVMPAGSTRRRQVGEPAAPRC